MEKICVFGYQYLENTGFDITAEKNGRYINLKNMVMIKKSTDMIFLLESLKELITIRKVIRLLQ